MSETTVKLDEWFAPEEGGVYRIEGGPSLTLRGRSHKRPMTGGPTKETTEISVEFEGEKSELTLESKGIQGRPQTELHPVRWKRWTFTSRDDAKVVIREVEGAS